MIRARNLGNGNYQVDGIILTKEQAGQIQLLIDKEYELERIETYLNENKEDLGIEENQEIKMNEMPPDIVDNMYDDFNDVYYGQDDDRFPTACDYLIERYAKDFREYRQDSMQDRRTDDLEQQEQER